MSKILCFCEWSGDQPKKGGLEMLSAASASGAEVLALAVGPGASKLSGSLAAYGAKKVLVCEDSLLAHYNPEAWCEAAHRVVTGEKPTLILASSSALARDLFPRLAARLGCGLASDCTELKISASGAQVEARKPLYSGKCTATVDLGSAATKIVLMRANQLPVAQAKAGATAEVQSVELSKRDFRTIVKEVVRGASQKLDLTEANIIVSGGRGMKAPEHFKLLEDLAAVLGATVGASRAVVDAGWVPHGMQVGQTGKTVAPTLYIACGISGAIQHLAGMSGAKVIVAINTDPDAPIFQKATYGIVGDLFTVLPLLTQEFKALLH